MPKFHCAYCGTWLTHDSLSVRNKHFCGRNHQRNVEIYWKTVAKEKSLMPRDPATSLNSRPKSTPFVDPLDQWQEIRAATPALGIDAEADKYRDDRTLPPPANIPTPDYPRTYLPG